MLHLKSVYLLKNQLIPMDSLLTDTFIGYNFSVSENQQMVGQMAKDFAEKHIRPHVMEWDEEQHFPIELFKKLGELGIDISRYNLAIAKTGYLPFLTASAELSTGYSNNSRDAYFQQFAAVSLPAASRPGRWSVDG